MRKGDRAMNGTEEGVLLDDVAQEPITSVVERNKLKLVLLATDAIAIILGYSVALLTIGYPGGHGLLRSLALIGGATIAGMWAIRSQGLLLSRVSSVRVLELTRISRAVGILGVLVLLLDRVLRFDFAIRQVLLSSALTLTFLVASRSVYRGWLSKARESGTYCRRIVLLGVDEEAARLHELFETHREIGIRVVGVIGDRAEAKVHHLDDLWLGEIDKTVALVDFANASGVVVSPNGVPMWRLNGLVRELHGRGLHVHLATGISGIDSRRLRSTPVAHEPLLYVEALTLGRVQLLSKRIMDVALAMFALVVLSPMLLAIAALIKVEDRGPVFFKQRRVGRDAHLFDVIKFRTMFVDAENKLSSLQENNERNGPLFKMTNDPRVTRIGRFLRDSGLDELPQLINVRRGEMSLVGPRPALPKEVESFSADHRARDQVMPGISGLWQVEARDNPSFEAYRRLDLFYVENWSITLDLLIILGTVEQFASRLFAQLLRRSGRRVRAALDPMTTESIPESREVAS